MAYLSARSAGRFHSSVSALLVPKPPTGLGWLHEVKHDGYRIIARKDGSRVTLWSRYGTNFTDRLPKIAEAVCSLAAESALIDGRRSRFVLTGTLILPPCAQRRAPRGPASSRSIS